jgi:glutamate dehydrogenase
VDLLWNGGIGTYGESARRIARRGARLRQRRHSWRLTQVRARVIGEGGNLGCHAARPRRVRAVRRPGEIRRPHQTDFIDNSAGVNTSTWK